MCCGWSVRSTSTTRSWPRMHERGVEVFLLSELLADALAASDDGRQRLIELVASEYTVGWSLVDEVRGLLADLKPDQLAEDALDRRVDRRRGWS